MRSKTPPSGDTAAFNLIAGERDSATTLSPSQLAHLRRLAQIHDTGRSTDTDAESERGTGSPPTTVPIIIADDGGHRGDGKAYTALLGHISPELYPAWVRVSQAHQLTPDYNLSENNNPEKEGNYKSFRRRSIAIERLRDDRETKALVNMLTTEPRQFARNSWPSQGGLRTSGHRREDTSPTRADFAPPQVSHDSDGKPLKPYRRGSITDAVSNGVLRKRSTKHRQPSQSDEMDFDEAFAAYQNRERRRKSSYVKVLKQAEVNAAPTNVIIVTAVILVALIIVMLVAAHLRKSQGT